MNPRAVLLRVTSPAPGCKSNAVLDHAESAMLCDMNGEDAKALHAWPQMP